MNTAARRLVLSTALAMLVALPGCVQAAEFDEGDGSSEPSGQPDGEAGSEPEGDGEPTQPQPDGEPEGEPDVVEEPEPQPEPDVMPEPEPEETKEPDATPEPIPDAEPDAEPEGCQEDCTDKSCGDDGCGGSCGTCGFGTFCDTPDEAAWTCVAQLCSPGEDFCQGSILGLCNSEGSGSLPSLDEDCALAGENMSCVEEGGEPQCACVPQCADKDCGDDGCGGSCDTCQGETFCQAETGQCEAWVCTPNEFGCNGDLYERCNEEGSGSVPELTEDCGEGGEQWSCDQQAGGCVCAPDCSNQECGDDGCSDICGTCSGGEVCDGANWQCLPPTCAPDQSFCEGSFKMTCNAWGTGAVDDGFDCKNLDQVCAIGQCADECVPDCGFNKVCGPDGCGGSCGACPDLSETCNEDLGQCVTPDGCGFENPCGGGPEGPAICFASYCKPCTEICAAPGTQCGTEVFGELGGVCWCPCEGEPGPGGGSASLLMNPGGFEDQHLEVPDHPLLQFNSNSADQPFSVSAWISAEFLNDGSVMTLLSKGASAAPNGQFNGGPAAEWAIWVQGGQVWFKVSDSDSVIGGEQGSAWVHTEGDITTLQAPWYHVIVTYDGNSTNAPQPLASGNAQVFVNSMSQSLSTGSVGSYVHMRSKGEPLRIGRDFPTDNAELFRGRIDEVSLWTGEISVGDVELLWGEGCPPDIMAAGLPVGPVALWRMGEQPNDSAGTIHDGSGNELHAMHINGQGSFEAGVCGAGPNGPICDPSAPEPECFVACGHVEDGCGFVEHCGNECSYGVCGVDLAGALVHGGPGFVAIGTQCPGASCHPYGVAFEADGYLAGGAPLDGLTQPGWALHVSSAVQQGGGGNLYLAGWTWNPDEPGRYGWVARVSPDGQPLWHWHWGETSIFTDVAIPVGSSSGPILVGHRESSEGDEDSYDSVALRLQDTDLSVLWNVQLWGDDLTEDRASAIAALPGGDLVVAGTRFSDNSATLGATLMLITADGVTSKQSMGDAGSGDDEWADIVVDPTDGERVYVAGWKATGPTVSSARMRRFDVSDGITPLNDEVFNPSGLGARFYGACPLPDGTIGLVGASRATGNIDRPFAASYEAFTTSSGKVDWETTVYTENNTPGSQERYTSCLGWANDDGEAMIAFGQIGEPGSDTTYDLLVQRIPIGFGLSSVPECMGPGP